MNKMNWYPWLNDAYKKIITSYKENKGHHALLLYSNIGMGSSIFMYAISRWLMCQQKLNIKSCGICHSCKLMLSNTHPDWHTIILDKNKYTVGIESIRYLNEILSNHSQQNGAKVIYFPYIESLTEAASNALLKNLEEPTNNTYFLLKCHNPTFLLTTIRSRCFYYHLTVPNKQITISWLKKQKIVAKLTDIQMAIKINHGSPITTLNLLQTKNWLKRKQFYKLLMKYLVTNKIFNWLPELNQPDVNIRIKWLISLLLDTIKYKQQIINHCINQDQLTLIVKLSNINSINSLFQSINEWQNCNYQLISSIGLNQELLLISQLINWTKHFIIHN
ncbi:MAG: DNA polymerase III subunit delta' [Arsenophonus endosymbiont of Ceratovacuna japonica]